jgi:predicted nucleotidyltransferase
LVERQRRLRRAADIVTDILATFEEVDAVALFGSAARPLWKEVPRFSAYRRAGIELWHECKDVDIVVWLDRLDRLREMWRRIHRALNAIYGETGSGVPPHEVDLFVLDPRSGRYLGRICYFKACPAGKRECLVAGCGATPFLKQHEGFRFHPDALARDRAIRLFDRASGIVRRAVDLGPPPCDARRH